MKNMVVHWIFLAILTAFFYALYNIFIKIASGSIHEILGAVILQMVAALLGGVLLLILKIRGTDMEISPRGIGLSVLAGVFVGLAEVFSFLVFAKGVPASAGIPVIIGGSVLFAGLIGLFFLREQFSFSALLGLLFIIAGIYFLSRTS
jgi:transporter family protein